MHEVKPKAELIEYGSHLGNISRIYAGYRRCYSASDNAEVKALPSDMEAFIRKMMKSGHESPLEHASLTFHLTCSRACSHQLVRHRIASYSQQSQRYVKLDDLPVIVPPTFEETEQRHHRFVKVMQDLSWDYGCALEAGIPAEDARYLLPHCVATQIVVTMNFRSLLHFFNERCCNRAQWEIRDLAGQMLTICKELYPCVFDGAGPKCIKLGRCPEAKPCGARPWKENHE
jgi:thymidylate synthase (FAD)